VQVLGEGARGVTADVAEAYNSAYEVMENCVRSEAAYRAAVSPAAMRILNLANSATACDKLELRVRVGRDTAGNYAVTDMEGRTMEEIDALEGDEQKGHPLWEPAFKMTFDGAAEVTAAFNDIVELFRKPVQSAVKQYLKFCVAAYRIAKRRTYAALNTDLKLIPFIDTLKQKNALHPSHRDNKLPAPAGPAPDPLADLEPLSPDTAAITLLTTELNKLLAVCENSASSAFVSPAATAAPHTYWLQQRATYPLVADTMLFWLSHAMGSAGVERDFCGLTMINRSFRRRRMRFKTFRGAVMSHCYKACLWKKLQMATGS